MTKILTMIKETRLFPSVIKSIKNTFYLASTLTLGISTTIFVLTVHFVGSDNVIAYAKAVLPVA